MKIKILIPITIFLVSACLSAPTQIVPPTIIPTSTLQPTPTYLPITPVLQGTQLPEYGDVIKTENIDRLTLLSRWGKGNPNDVIYSPDGKYFVIGTSAGLYFYDSSDYSFIHFIDTQAAVFDLAISPDSQTIAVVVTRKVLMYQIPNWKLMFSINVNANSIDFSPDGKTMALGVNPNSDYLQLRDAKTGREIDTFRSGQAVWEVKISPRGDVIATGGFSTTIWSMSGSTLDQYGPYVSGGHTASVSFSPDGKLLAEGSDYFLNIWRVLDNGRIINYREIDLSQFNYASIFHVAISPDGKMVATALSSGIGVWNLSTGRRVFYSASESGFTFYNGLAWSSDSSTIATASNETGVELWNVNTGENIVSLNTPSGTFSSIAWSSDGLKLGVGAEEGVAYVFNTQNGTLFNNFGSGYELNSIAFAPDNQSLALGYGGRTAQIWSLDGNLQQTIEGFGYGSSDVTYSSDGVSFAAISPESWQTPPQVRIWNTRDWEVEKIFPVGDRDNYRITGFALAPDQNTGAISYVEMIGYHTEFIKIISIEGGTTLANLEPKRNQYRVLINATKYSPDNSMLATFVSEYDDPNPRILVWRTNDWSLLYQITINSDPHLGFSKNQKDTLTWSPDSRLIAVGVKDGKIQIFRAFDGKKLISLNAHTMWVTGISFSPDGHNLASVSLDGTLMLWGLR